MKKNSPLSELEMYELISAAYPGKFASITDEDKRMDEVFRFVEELAGYEGIADLLGRVVMMTYPMQSKLTKKHYHVLGNISLSKDKSKISALALVKREFDTGDGQ